MGSWNSEDDCFLVAFDVWWDFSHVKRLLKLQMVQMLLLHLLGLYKYLTMCTSITKTEKKTDSRVEHLHVFLKGLIGDNDAI